MSPPRVLILEILNSDRFRSYRSHQLPYFNAELPRLGVETRWVTVGVVANEARGGEELYVYDLGEEDRRRVSQAIEDWAPTHVLLNEKLASGLFTTLRRELPDVKLKLLEFVDSDVQFAAVGRWLGLDMDAFEAEAVLLEDSVVPDLHREALNHLANEIQPFAHLNLGPECVYNKSIAPNPHYVSIDLEKATRTGGCTFCLYPEHGTQRPLKNDVIDLALRQIEAAERTCPEAMRSREYQVHGMPLWFALDRFARALVERGVPASSFHFSARIDELLSIEDKLDEALGLFEEHGHRLCLYNIGIENFSEAENARFNKGLRIETIERGVERVAELRERYPKAFRFLDTGLGGFGLILFTPWTTLEDLRINSRYFRRYRIDASGLALDSALQAIPRQPITLLAEADGLLVDEFEDYRYDSGCITDAGTAELPWRFAHPEVATVYAIGRRLSRVADIPPNEPKYACIQGWLQGLPEKQHDTLAVFDALLDVVEADPGDSSVVAVLRAVETRLGERSAFDLSAVDDEELERAVGFEDVRREGLPSFWEVVAEQIPRVYARSDQARQSLSGYAIEEVRMKRFVDHFGLEVDLDRQGTPMRLFVEEAAAGRRCYLERDGFAVSYALPRSPSQEQRTLMNGLLQVVAHVAAQS